VKRSGTVTISFCMTLSVDIGLECWCADMQALCTNLNKAKRTESAQQTDRRTGAWNDYINPLWATLYMPPCLSRRENKLLRRPRIDSKEPIPPGCVSV
jgi:hypothetical protein